jgi:hypothetical protein
MIDVIGRIKGCAIAGLAVLAAFFMIFLKGRAQGRAAEIQKQEVRNAETKKRIDAVDAVSDADTIERLRDGKF